MTYIIEHPLGGQFEIAEYNFPNKMNWREAKIACKELGEGWRLPKKAVNLEYHLDLYEMETIHEFLFQKNLGNLPEGGYWSEMIYNPKSAWCFNMQNQPAWSMPSKNELYYVRAVRRLF